MPTLSPPTQHSYMPPLNAGGAFIPTQWSLVRLAAGSSQDSARALEKLCRAYLPPVFAFIRREGNAHQECEDLTQEFFKRLLAAESFAAATPTKGRFRSWLIGALKNFLHSEWRKSARQKRGSGQTILSLDAMEPARREACAPRDEETPESAYDRRWAETLMTLVMNRLKREYELAGMRERYESMRGYLLPTGPMPSYGATASQLGLTEAATKSAIYKMRQRFGTLLRHEVGQTVTDASEVEDELRALLRALRF